MTKASLKFFRRFIIIVLILFGLNVAKDLFFQNLLEKRIAELTGHPTTIGALHVSLLGGSFHAKDVLLSQTGNFEKGTVAWISECTVDWDLPAFIQGNYKIRQMWIVIEELFVIKKRDGEVNLKALQRENPFPLVVEALDLTVLRVIYKNYETVPLTISEWYPRIRHKRYQNLQTIEELVQAVFLTPFLEEAREAGFQ